jgi:phosphohistidine phosphatase
MLKARNNTKLSCLRAFVMYSSEGRVLWHCILFNTEKACPRTKIHSGKTRARQTAEIFDAALNPPVGIHDGGGLNPLDDVIVFADTIDNTKDVMLVGHLPFMERLTAYLITGSSEKAVFKFQNSGIVCLDKDPTTESWVIKWTLMPHIG